MSYIWPDEPERFAHVKVAIEIAREQPTVVDATDVVAWVDRNLTEPTPGSLTVI